jgi:hypothetical protein
MSKKHFIELADCLKAHNARNLNAFGRNAGRMNFSSECIETLANFCQAQNPRFDRARWIAYIAGTCGPNGGAK